MKETLLFVDNDEFIKEVYTCYLKEKEYAVYWHVLGQDATQQIFDGLYYDIGLFDRSLPDMSGDEVMTFSKQINPLIPVVCHSGYDTKPNCADFLIVKPKSPEELEEIIQKLLHYAKAMRSKD